MKGALLVWLLAAADSVNPVQHYRQTRLAAELHTRGELAKAEQLYAGLVRESPQDAELWMRFGDTLSGLGAHARAAEAWQEGLARGCRYSVFYTYDVARAYAQAGAHQEALRWLERALAEGYEHRPSIASDEAFAALRSDPAFRRLAGEPVTKGSDRSPGWRNDLAHFVAEVKRMHWLYRDRPLPASFEAGVRALGERVAGLSDQAIVVELARLAALLGDGHTTIFLGPGMRRLPVRFYLFSDGLHVIDAPADKRDWVGRRVVKLGDLDTEQALKRTEELMPRDNEIAVRVLGPLFLTYVEILKAVGATDMAARVVLTLEERGGAQQAVEIQPAADSGRPGPPPKLGPSPLAGSGAAPLYLRRVGDAYWFEPLPDQEAVYFQFNQVMDMPDQSLSEFAERLRRFLDEQQIANLVIDVRQNNGGNAELLTPLLRALVWFDARGGRLFVITGRYTFSAAQIFINNVERLTRAVFAGEPSGSSPNFVGEDTELLLPFSGVRGSVSSRYHQTDGLDRRKLIAPQVPVMLSSADYFANRDPALDAVLRLIADEVRP